MGRWAQAGKRGRGGPAPVTLIAAPTGVSWDIPQSTFPAVNKQQFIAQPAGTVFTGFDYCVDPGAVPPAGPWTQAGYMAGINTTLLGNFAGVRIWCRAYYVDGSANVLSLYSYKFVDNGS